jgi:NAD(P)H-hydrate epimerase
VYIPDIFISQKDHLPLEKFREMDYLAVNAYGLPIELMMENAGLHLARIITHILPVPGKVLIGIGPGNNGGGGLVAARRLSAWGYKVVLDVPVKELRTLPKLQLARALAFGSDTDTGDKPDVFVDAYLGFSQRLPLSRAIQESIDRSLAYSCPKISLDIPTGFDKFSGEAIFEPDMILTLGAMKSELIQLKGKTGLYLADLGLPAQVYKNFHMNYPQEFRIGGLLRCKFTEEI